jgi:hypothetical protein
MRRRERELSAVRELDVTGGERACVAGERTCRRPVRELASFICYGGFEERLGGR